MTRIANDHLVHDDRTDTYKIILEDEDGTNLVVPLTSFELRRTFLVLVSHFCLYSPEITTSLKGMVTGQDDKGIDHIVELVGYPKSAQYRAQKLVDTKAWPGCKAWLCIGETGTCAHLSSKYDHVFDEDDDGDEEPDETGPQATMDRWLS